MAVNNFLDTLVQYLASNYNLDPEIDPDIFVDLNSHTCTYKTEICDRLSDFLKIAPSVISKSFVDKFNSEYLQLSADNRGFIYLHTSSSDFILPVEKTGTSKVCLFIQPPADRNRFDLSYMKLISQALLHIRLLKYRNKNCTVYISSSSGLHEIDIKKTNFDDAVIKILNILSELACKPRTDYIEGFTSLLQDESNTNIPVLFLNSEFLCLPKVSSTLNKVKQAAGYKTAVQIYSQRLDPDYPLDLFEDFMKSYAEHKLLTCSYLTELSHFNDLDWKSVNTDNWINLRHLIDSFFKRIKTGNQQSSNEKMDFLLNNFSLTANRALYAGGTHFLIKTMREIALAGHKLLNNRVNLDYLAANSGYALMSDLSNIIR